MKCSPRLGSHRHTHCTHGAKEREALDIISIPPDTEQSPLALLPRRVWNPGFPLLNSVGCSLFWFRWCLTIDTQNSNLSRQCRDSQVTFRRLVLRTFFGKLEDHIPVHDLRQAAKHFRLGFLTSPNNILLLKEAQS